MLCLKLANASHPSLRGTGFWAQTCPEVGVFTSEKIYLYFPQKAPRAKLTEGQLRLWFQQDAEANKFVIHIKRNKLYS